VQADIKGAKAQRHNGAMAYDLECKTERNTERETKNKINDL
jgi:hypothetical protein